MALRQLGFDFDTTVDEPAPHSWTIGSLFSGIGGLEYGLEAAGLGPTLWQVESNEFCRRKLEHAWPYAQRYTDVRTFNGRLAPPVAVLCGGFPCQDVSSAGKRVGLSGAQSGLWDEFARIATEVDPEWIVIENVASGAKNWVDAVCRDLERLGYASLPVPIAACDLGAFHRRGRVFIVAHSDRATVRLDQQRVPARWPTAVRDEGQAEPRYNGWAGGRDSEPEMVRVVHGVSDRLDPERRHALGNAVVPACATVIGHLILHLSENS